MFLDDTYSLESSLYLQQCKMLKEIFNTEQAYKNVLKKKLFQMQFENTVSQDSEEIAKLKAEIQTQIQGVSKIIEIVLSFMTKENAWLIEKCYIDPETKDSSDWYLDHFSKTTFYKRKREAIQEFVNFYFNHVS